MLWIEPSDPVQQPVAALKREPVLGDAADSLHSIQRGLLGAMRRLLLVVVGAIVMTMAVVKARW